MTTNEYFAASLRFYRKQMGWNQEILAEKIDVSTRTIQLLESGNNLPSLTVLIRIAELFNTSMDDLLGLQGTKDIALRNIISDMSKDEKQLVIEFTEAIIEMLN